MSRLAILLYGVIVYVLFLVTFLAVIAFLNGIILPKGINDGAVGSAALAIAVNVGILGLFGIQHTIMARPQFKAWWTRIVPVAAERSTFVLVTCAILALMIWQWRPLPAVVWHVDALPLRVAIHAVSALGWGIVLYSTFLISHFDLFGLRQVILHARGRAYTPKPFMERSLYRVVQHPLMVGFAIAFWATPDMTVGHLVFAATCTAYMVVGTRIEERDIRRHLGSVYAEYQARTPRFMPRRRRPVARDVTERTLPTG